jgi:hypothetical protein
MRRSQEPSALGPRTLLFNQIIVMDTHNNAYLRACELESFQSPQELTAEDDDTALPSILISSPRGTSLQFMTDPKEFIRSRMGTIVD